MIMKVKLDEGAFEPSRAHATDAGLDIRAAKYGYVEADSSKVFETGVHVELPQGYAGLLVSKSGLNVNHCITSTGLIDEGFTGEIKVRLYNHSNKDYIVEPGDKITQLAVIPVEYVDIEIVDEITASERGDSGYGSTGRK